MFQSPNSYLCTSALDLFGISRSLTLHGALYRTGYHRGINDHYQQSSMARWQERNQDFGSPIRLRHVAIMYRPISARIKRETKPTRSLWICLELLP